MMSIRSNKFHLTLLETSLNHHQLKLVGSTGTVETVLF